MFSIWLKKLKCLVLVAKTQSVCWTQWYQLGRVLVLRAKGHSVMSRPTTLPPFLINIWKLVCLWFHSHQQLLCFELYTHRFIKVFYIFNTDQYNLIKVCYIQNYSKKTVPNIKTLWFVNILQVYNSKSIKIFK